MKTYLFTLVIRNNNRVFKINIDKQRLLESSTLCKFALDKYGELSSIREIVLRFNNVSTRSLMIVVDIINGDNDFNGERSKDLVGAIAVLEQLGFDRYCDKLI